MIHMTHEQLLAALRLHDMDARQVAELLTVIGNRFWQRQAESRKDDAAKASSALDTAAGEFEALADAIDNEAYQERIDAEWQDQRDYERRMYDTGRV